MTYTSVVKDPFNSYPGMIFTDPAPNTDGDWAKYGCFDHVDYTNRDINAKVFLGIISGDKEAVAKETGKKNPKVLSAGPDDTVFTYFIDHGNNDIICVGNDLVTSKQLMEALKTAHEKKLYGKWVWFMEACHSGSMFRKLEKGKNVYAMTGSDTEHSAWMCNCPPHDKVNGKSMGTCLSAWYDNMWMEEVMKKGADISLKDMYQTVHDTVAKHTDQNVSQFGDIRTMGDLPVKEFIGDFQPQHTRPDTGTCVKYEDAARDTAKWDAIRNGANGMENYKDFVFEEAKKDIACVTLTSPHT